LDTHIQLPPIAILMLPTKKDQKKRRLNFKERQLLTPMIKALQRHLVESPRVIFQVEVEGSQLGFRIHNFILLRLNLSLM
jgi:hypothetical protein